MNSSSSSTQSAGSRLDHLIDELATHGDQALVEAFTRSESRQHSYHDIGEQVRALAGGIRQHTEPGEAVVVIGDDSPEWIIAALAALRAGAMVTPLDVQLADDVLEGVLKDSAANLIFASQSQAKRLNKLAAKAQLVLLDADENDADSWRQLLDAETGLPDNQADDPAALFYTSGTTGPPKGVPLTHANLGFQLDTVRDAGIVQKRDRVLLPLPLHHVYPFVIGMLVPIALGLTLILPHALTGPQVLRALREGRASVIIGVPRLYAAVYQGIETEARRSGRLSAGLFHSMLFLSRLARRRLGMRLGKMLLRPVHRKVGRQLRILASGGSALDPALAWNLEALGWQVATGYGLTETSPLLTIDPPGQLRPATAGRPIRGVKLRIARQDDDDENGDAKEGEIQARGPNVFKEYRNQPDKTRESFTDDGWYRTGDLGWLDDDRYLHITGRASTLIVTEGGENIQPDDLEERYAEHPAIREIGILQQENDLVALIVPEVNNNDDLEEQIRDALSDIARDLPSYQHLNDFALTHKPLPRTRLGKLKRPKLEDRYQRAQEEGAESESAQPLDPSEMSGEDRNLLEAQAARTAWDWLAERYPKQGLTPDTRPQLELGVDSLEWLTLTMEISQRTGVELSDEAIGRIETVRDLLSELVDAAESESGGEDPLEEPEQVLDAQHRRWLRPRGRGLRAVARALYGIDWALMRGAFRLQVEGRKHLPAKGPVVLACTHGSHLDPFAVAAALSFKQLNRLYWGGWTGVAFNNFVTRGVSRTAQVIPIDPKRGVRSSLALAALALKRDKGLIWFPEGQRSESGELQSLRPGIGMLLEHYPVPVVPVSIRGSHAAMPPGRIIPYPHRLTVRFGEPLETKDLLHQGEGEKDAERIVQALEEHLRELHEASHASHSA